MLLLNHVNGRHMKHLTTSLEMRRGGSSTLTRTMMFTNVSRLFNHYNFLKSQATNLLVFLSIKTAQLWSLQPRKAKMLTIYPH